LAKADVFLTITAAIPEAWLLGSWMIVVRLRDLIASSKIKVVDLILITNPSPTSAHARSLFLVIIELGCFVLEIFVSIHVGHSFEEGFGELDSWPFLSWVVLWPAPRSLSVWCRKNLYFWLRSLLRVDDVFADQIVLPVVEKVSRPTASLQYVLICFSFVSLISCLPNGHMLCQPSLPAREIIISSGSERSGSKGWVWVDGMKMGDGLMFAFEAADIDESVLDKQFTGWSGGSWLMDGLRVVCYFFALHHREWLLLLQHWSWLREIGLLNKHEAKASEERGVYVV